MKISAKKQVFLFVMAFYLVGCTRGHPTDTSMTSVDFLDISVRSTDQKINPNDIYLYVTNKTNDCVVFPYNYGLEIFMKVNESWVKVNNLVEYANTENRPLTSSSGIEPDDLIFIRPDYSNVPGKPSDIRIILNAYLCKNGKPSSNLSNDYIEIPLVY
jgi:hypothetical protein